MKTRRSIRSSIITLMGSVSAAVFPGKRKAKLKEAVYTDTMIDLAERQFAARDAMGEKYILHPSKSPKKNQPNLRLIKGEHEK